METAGGLIGAFGKLAAKLEHRHHTLERRDLAPELFGELVVLLDRYAAAVVFDGY